MFLKMGKGKVLWHGWGSMVLGLFRSAKK